VALVYKFDVTLFTGFCRIIEIKEGRMHHFDAELGLPHFEKWRNQEGWKARS
jgi:hypothetical protein